MGPAARTDTRSGETTSSRWPVSVPVVRTVPAAGNAGTDHRQAPENDGELMDLTIAGAKTAAHALRRALADDGIALTHSRALEIVARQLGFSDWNIAAARLHATTPGVGTVVPVLRIQDDALARAFYLDYLAFQVEWEHRFAPDLPLYVRIRKDDAVLDLSEHHGDGTPGSVVWVPVADVAALHADLASRPHPRLRPGIDHDSPGGPTMEVIDPFSNTLRFCQPTG